MGRLINIMLSGVAGLEANSWIEGLVVIQMNSTMENRVRCTIQGERSIKGRKAYCKKIEEDIFFRESNTFPLMLKGERNHEKKTKSMKSRGAVIAGGVRVLPSNTKVDIVEWFCH